MKPLIAFFSWSGTTKELAGKLQKMTGGDLYRIEREHPYSTSYAICAYLEAKQEYDTEYRPPLKTPVPDMDAYDAVLLAFPIWWYTMPMPVWTFLESVPDWKRKRIYLFVCSYSPLYSQYTGVLRNAAFLAPSAIILPGLYNPTDTELKKWIREKLPVVCETM